MNSNIFELFLPKAVITLVDAHISHLLSSFAMALVVFDTFLAIGYDKVFLNSYGISCMELATFLVPLSEE